MWLTAPLLLSSPPLFLPVPAIVWRHHCCRCGNNCASVTMTWCCVMYTHSNFFFYLSYFSLPSTHHMTLVEMNTFSHHHVLPITHSTTNTNGEWPLSPLFPTPMPGMMKVGGSRHRSPWYVFFLSIFIYYWLYTGTLRMTTKTEAWDTTASQASGMLTMMATTNAHHHQTPGQTRGLKMHLHLEPQVSSYYFVLYFFALLTIFFTIRLYACEQQQRWWTHTITKHLNEQGGSRCICILSLRGKFFFFCSFFFALLTSFFLQLDNMCVNYDSDDDHIPPPVPTSGPGWTEGQQ